MMLGLNFLFSSIRESCATRVTIIAPAINRASSAGIATLLAVTFAGLPAKSDTKFSVTTATDVEISTPAPGLISFQNLPTCADLARGGTAASALAPTLSFESLRLVWKPKDRDLLVSGLRITITSSKIIGGMQAIALSSEEIASLVGVQSGIISADEIVGNRLIESNRPENRPGFPLCQLNVGALNFTSANPGAFKADVTIELIGMSLNSANGADRRSEKRIFKTTAQFTN